MMGVDSWIACMRNLAANGNVRTTATVGIDAREHNDWLTTAIRDCARIAMAADLFTAHHG